VVSSGREALSRLEQDSAFDAILCDLMMPDVSGIAVYHALRERHPELVERFAFMTGGAFTAEAREFFLDYSGARLDKPFNVAQVEALLARVARPC
jgi:CheY-like chemotaxis protein